jgi:hypothetical protein
MQTNTGARAGAIRAQRIFGARGGLLRNIGRSDPV